MVNSVFIKWMSKWKHLVEVIINNINLENSSIDVGSFLLIFGQKSCSLELQQCEYIVGYMAHVNENRMI